MVRGNFIGMVFLAMYCYAQEELSLKKIVTSFNGMFNKQTSQEFSSYMGVLFQMTDNKNKPLSDHVVYRAELARILYCVGYDIFNHIKKFLHDWDALMKIPLYNVSVNHWYNHANKLQGASVYYRKGERFEAKFDGEVSKFFNSHMNSFQAYFSNAIAYELKLVDKSNLTSCNKLVYYRKNECRGRHLFWNPQEGVIFFHQYYCGIINRHEQKAIINDLYSHDPAEPDCKRTIDFSNIIPWDALKSKVEVFFYQDTLLIIYGFENDHDSSPKIQVMYMIAKKPKKECELFLADNYAVHHRRFVKKRSYCDWIAQRLCQVSQERQVVLSVFIVLFINGIFLPLITPW